MKITKDMFENGSGELNFVNHMGVRLDVCLCCTKRGSSVVVWLDDQIIKASETFGYVNRFLDSNSDFRLVNSNF